MLVARMVDDQVHQQLHAPLVAARDEVFHIFDGPILRIDAVVVGNVVAHVHLRRLVGRRQPDYIGPQLLYMVQFGHDSGNVTDSIVIGVLERGRPDLVDRAFLPPGPVDWLVNMLVCLRSHCFLDVKKPARRREVAPGKGVY